MLRYPALFLRLISFVFSFFYVFLLKGAKIHKSGDWGLGVVKKWSRGMIFISDGKISFLN